MTKQASRLCTVLDIIPAMDSDNEVVGLVLEESTASDDVERLTHGVSDVMMWMADEAGSMAECNSMTAEVLGYQDERELMHKSLVDELMTEDCGERGHRVLQQVMNEHESVGDLTFEMRRRDGSEVKVLVDVSPVREWTSDVDLSLIHISEPTRPY